MAWTEDAGRFHARQCDFSPRLDDGLSLNTGHVRDSDSIARKTVSPLRDGDSGFRELVSVVREPGRIVRKLVPTVRDLIRIVRDLFPVVRDSVSGCLLKARR